MPVVATIAVVVIAIIFGAFIVNLGAKKMSEALDRLTEEVAQSRAATTSAIALIGGLSQQIRDGADDPAKMKALADDLDAQQASIAAAVTANTPAADVADEEAPPVEQDEQQQAQGGTGDAPQS